MIKDLLKVPTLNKDSVNLHTSEILITEVLQKYIEDDKLEMEFPDNEHKEDEKKTIMIVKEPDQLY